MNNIKRGKYLVLLRKRKGLTQLEVADLLHFTDKNISKWETGKSFPSDPNVLNDIANLYDVPVENIIYGEDNAIDKINELVLKKVNFNIIRSYLIIVLILSFLLLFIINKYNNYYVAKISSNNINESNVFIILTNEYNRLKFNKLKSNNNDIKLISFYYEKDNQKYLLFETENEDIVITEYSYYLEYNFKSIVENDCYIKVLYSDETNDIFKLKFNKYLSSLFT
jgi:transcriptional regulator with XRE-family HTH domain